MLPASFTPDLLRQLELLKIQARRAFLGSRQGGHLSQKRGHGIEFSDYRHYELGDNPRHIDWGVYARSEKLYVKRFQEEQDLTVLILLDTSPSMYTPADENKWELARDVALALSYVALMEQDSVVVSALGKFLSPRYQGARAIHHLGTALSQLKLEGASDFMRDLQRAVATVRFPGIAVLISDFLMPLEQIRSMFGVLRAKNLEISAVQILSPSDISPLKDLSSLIAVDSESGEEVELEVDDDIRSEYGVLLMEHNESFKAICADGSISHTMAASSQSLSEVMLGGLALTGLLR